MITIMRAFVLSLLLLTTMAGCGSIKAATGEYVTEAVKEDIARRLDEVLEKRGLSGKEIKSAIDENNDNTVSRDEVYGTIKEMTRDYVLLEARNYVEGKLQIAATKDDVNSAGNRFWQWFLGLIAAYLSKQLWSQKQDNKRDQRIALLEKFVHKDLDGDGLIGGEALDSSDDEVTV